jgi:hypothetical protein
MASTSSCCARTVPEPPEISNKRAKILFRNGVDLQSNVEGAARANVWKTIDSEVCVRSKQNYGLIVSLREKEHGIN